MIRLNWKRIGLWQGMTIIEGGKCLHSAFHPSDGNLDIILTACFQRVTRYCNEGAPSFQTSGGCHLLGNRVLVRGERGWRGHKIQHEYRSSNPTWSLTQCCVIHTSPLSPLVLIFSIRNIHTHTLRQAPHLPQFAEQTVRRSTPQWGSFSGAGDMKSPFNTITGYCVAIWEEGGVLHSIWLNRNAYTICNVTASRLYICRYIRVLYLTIPHEWHNLDLFG